MASRLIVQMVLFFLYILRVTNKNIINFARAQRLGWYGHIETMQETRMVKAIHSWKPISKRATGRPKIRWEDDVKKGYTEVESA